MIIKRLSPIGAFLLLELPTKLKPLTHYRNKLESNGDRLLSHLTQIDANTFAEKILNHVIGIERWGTSRLEVAIGATFVQDEYNSYRPARDAKWNQLIEDFAASRENLLKVIDEIIASDSGQTKILHNQYGNLSVKAWLQYLDLHANIEAKKIKQLRELN